MTLKAIREGSLAERSDEKNEVGAILTKSHYRRIFG